MIIRAPLIDKVSKPVWCVIGLLFLCGVAIGDYLTGTELSFSFLYLIPIGIFSLAFNAKAGMATAFLCAVIWFFVEALTSENTSAFVHFWNTAIRLGFFLLPTILLRVVEQERCLARTDSLTGAFNNRYFIELLQREIDRSVRYRHFFTVAFIDTDNFKTINDTFGHAFGDSALQVAIKLMKKHLRKTDMVARVGGDEFAILLPETDDAAARSAITNMTGKLSSELIEMKYPITFSIGVLTLSAPHLSADEVLRMADKMMYIVKNNGKNNVRYEVYSEEKEAVKSRE